MSATTFSRIRPWLVAGTCIGIAACSTIRNGFPNHAMAPSLIEPSKQPATDSKAMYLDLIRQMQQQGSYYASLAHIDAFRLRYGDPPELQRMQGDALRETGQDDAAAKVYQGMLHGSQAASAWHGLGLIAARQRRYAEAEKDLQEATRIEPVNVTYLNDLGYARLAAGDIANAHEPLAEAAELEPTNTKVVSNLALWASLQGDDVQSDAIMQRANLPQSTRDAVHKLAMQMRLQTRLAETALPSPSRDKAAMATPSQGIPSTLLDRLGNTPSNGSQP
ncbi:tetratricopeptide repeat protein [Dyella mobilis]|uniref:Tetratricopeptide repeat protein n=1 Tax=Dyella mobilis TaxID=1849582 RepID=A0ABS2KB95_9GAMM|nr:tetratricopeptide repeat protein [Dyella mobilis]MBM7128448.1 tetratricopeptide repeat protein [Dyella mobilis]GLQ99754.1 lipoprotein [Dyella mobilis]